MKKIAKILIIVGVIIVLGVAVTLLALNFSKTKTNLPEIASATDLRALLERCFIITSYFAYLAKMQICITPNCHG